MRDNQLPDSPITRFPNDDDWLLVGRVARSHGNRGEVIVNLETDFPQDRFTVGRILQTSADGRLRRIVSVRFHDGRPVIALEGIESIEAAQALAGAELRAAVSDLAPLPAHTFYRHDLVGCEVRTRSGEQVGRVTAVEGPMERSQLVVSGRRGEVLIPLASEICVSIDPGAQTIVVDPPEGLLDLN